MPHGITSRSSAPLAIHSALVRCAPRVRVRVSRFRVRVRFRVRGRAWG